MDKFEIGKLYNFVLGDLHSSFPVTVLRNTHRGIKLERTDSTLPANIQSAFTFWIPHTAVKLDNDDIIVSHFYEFNARQKAVILFNKYKV